MKPEINHAAPSVWLPNIAVLILVAIGLLSEKVPLVSLRPPSLRGVPDVGESPARLWQDPLAIKPPAGLELSVTPFDPLLDAVVEHRDANRASRAGRDRHMRSAAAEKQANAAYWSHFFPASPTPLPPAS